MLTALGERGRERERQRDRETGESCYSQSVRCVSEHSSSNTDGGSQFWGAGTGHGLLYHEWGYIWEGSPTRMCPFWKHKPSPRGSY